MSLLLANNERTENIYWHWIDKYLKWNGSTLDRDILFSQRRVEQFVEYLKECNYAPSTINVAVAAIKKWGSGYGYAIQVTNKPPIKEKLPEILEEQEVKTLIQNIPDVRDRALFSLVFDTGLRISEALNLNLQDVNLDQNMVFIGRRKGKEIPSKIPFCETTKRYIMEYLEARKAQGISSEDNDPLFIGRGRLTPSAAWRLLDKWSRAILGKHVHPHQLRHAVAVVLRKKGVPLDVIRDFLGHRSDIVLRRYARLEPTELKKLPDRF